MAVEKCILEAPSPIKGEGEIQQAAMPPTAPALSPAHQPP